MEFVIDLNAVLVARMPIACSFFNSVQSFHADGEHSESIQGMSTLLASVVHWFSASGVVRLDGIGMIFAVESESSVLSFKPPVISELVKSLRRDGTETSRHNRCQANNQTYALTAEMKGSCKRGDGSVRLKSYRGSCTPWSSHRITAKRHSPMLDLSHGSASLLSG